MSAQARKSREPFGPALQLAMSSAGITFRTLAAKTGLSAGYLCHLAHGTRPAPDEKVIARVAAALGVAPGFFVETRLRAVTARLEEDPAEVDRLYRKLVAA